MKSESKLCRTVMQNLKSRGGFWYKVADRYRTGIPDILGWKDGISYAIELKAEDGKVSALQDKNLELLRREGVITGVCRSLSDVTRIIEEAENDRKSRNR